MKLIPIDTIAQVDGGKMAMRNQTAQSQCAPLFHSDYAVSSGVPVDHPSDEFTLAMLSVGCHEKSAQTRGRGRERTVFVM